MSSRARAVAASTTARQRKRSRFGSRDAHINPDPVRGHVLLLFQPVVGGVPQYVADLAEELVTRNWKVTVAGPSQTPVRGRLEAVAERVIDVRTSNSPRPFTDARICRQLVRYCREAGVDVIHAHSSKAGALAGIIGKMAGVTSLYSPHGWSFERELSPTARRAYVTAERVLARLHQRVIAVADTERTVALRDRVASGDRVATVPTGLRNAVLPERHEARRQLGLEQDSFVVGWVGRVGPQKRSEQLPQLARGLGDLGMLAVLGYGIAESEVGQALAGLGSRTVSGDPLLLYAAADALVVTSRWEGLPLVVLEAMRASLPVVTYDVGGVRDAVVDGQTGFVVESGDVDALGDRLRQLAEDPHLADEMGRAAWRRFDESFRIDRMVTSIGDIYGDALRQRFAGSKDPGDRSLQLADL
jgi:glycosyltransferase involved in cell wall biosynthesis